LAIAVFSVGASERRPLAIAAITSQQAEIRSEVMAGTGRYKDMPASTRDELLSRQSALLRMLDGKVSSNDLSEDEAFQAFNTLEWIEATINNTEDERMVCNREKTLGSNRLTRVCKTVAQIKAEKAAARLNFDRGCSNAVCIDP
jgi:flagellar motility protein MotE (MotC chaperone)